MFDTHDSDSPDGYVRPVFSVANKLHRLFWQLSWTILCRWTPAPMHGWRVWVLRRFGATLGQRNFIYPGCRIWAPWLLTTEDVVTIGPGVEVYNPGGVRLGHHSVLSQDAFLCGATHNYDSADFTYVAKEIVLEPYAWVCAKAIVLPGVRCGEGSVLGAGSVTSKHLNPWVVYAGNPARPLKERHNFLVPTVLE